MELANNYEELDRQCTRSRQINERIIEEKDIEEKENNQNENSEVNY